MTRPTPEDEWALEAQMRLERSRTWNKVIESIGSGLMPAIAAMVVVYFLAGDSTSVSLSVTVAVSLALTGKFYRDVRTLGRKDEEKTAELTRARQRVSSLETDLLAAQRRVADLERSVPGHRDRGNP